MSLSAASAMVAFLVGFIWGALRPAGYCHLSHAQRYGLGNRLGSGVINGVVFSAIVAFVTVGVFA